MAAWTEERKAARREQIRLRQEKNLAQYGTPLAPDTKEKLLKSREASSTARRDNSKARLYLPELLHWITSLTGAATDVELFNTLVEAYPERGIRWDRSRKHILFSFSTNSLREKFGILAEQMFRRLFTCYQPGGLSKETGKGFPSVWHLSEDKLKMWLMHSQTKNFSVSKAIKVLMKFPELRKSATDYGEGLDEHGMLRLVGLNKKVMDRSGREAIKAIREVKKAEILAKNQEVIKAWIPKKNLEKAEQGDKIVS